MVLTLVLTGTEAVLFALLCGKYTIFCSCRIRLLSHMLNSADMSPAESKNFIKKGNDTSNCD